jgi:hypothetical protein
MGINFDELAKYGLDRFTIEVKINKSEGGVLGFSIETRPITFEGISDQVHGLLPGGLLEGAKFASATMMVDGALIVNGFHDQTRSRLAEMLRKGRDEYFNGLTAMYDDKPRQNVAGDVADAVLTTGINPDDIVLQLACGHCGGAVDTLSDLLSRGGLIRDGKITIVPASWPAIKNGDFKAVFDQRVREQFPAMVKEQLRNKLPKARESRDQINRGIELAAKLVGE